MHTAPPLLNLVVIRSADLDHAERFYRVLGLTFDRHRHGSGPEHLAAQPYAGSYVFEIYPANAKAGPTSGVRIGFGMDAVDTYLDGLVKAGGTIIQAPADSEWGRRAVIADPDGHRVELVTPLNREADSIHS
jgi:predicted enzyme related to lactoylglutathione lyase